MGLADAQPLVWGGSVLAARASRRLAEALRAAHDRIRAFHEKQLQKSWDFTDADGTRLGQQVSPLERVGLGSRLHHNPNELSGGQRQRVAIARALVNDPSLLLADEPTGNLDSATSVEIMDLFDELHAAGNSVVLVTHEPDIAEYATRIVAFRDGRVRDDRPVLERRRAEDERAALEAAAEAEARIA